MAERAIEFSFHKYIFIIIFDHISLDTFSASSLSTAIKADGLTISSIKINFAYLAEYLQFHWSLVAFLHLNKNFIYYLLIL